jgi:hypothetical protein
MRSRDVQLPSGAVPRYLTNYLPTVQRREVDTQLAKPPVPASLSNVSVRGPCQGFSLIGRESALPSI